jgi:hypothetical protein
MKSRNLGVGLVVLASSVFALAGTATAATTPAAVGTCVVHSLPSFTAQGEESTAATVADVVEVECNPNIYGTGSRIKITASQLFSRCEGKLTWYVPNPYEEVVGKGVTVRLDADGNATVALIAGSGCSAGESLVSAHMEEEPFETFTTSFTVLPPNITTPGVFALPSTQVEDSLSSSVATIIEAEFADGSEKEVRIAGEELFARCRIAPHLRWIRDNREVESDKSEIEKVPLDNDGNGFVVAVGDGSCAEGPSLIEADLESKPFTTFMTNFTIEAPRPTN